MKKILITGCSSGFGFHASKYLAENGHHVIASMRNVDGKNAGAAKELSDFAQEKGVKIDVLDIDVTSDESVAAAASQLPVVDVLINNAGLGYGGITEAFSSDSILAQLDLNIVGTVRMAKAVLPGMRAQKSGLIIQVSSVVGRSSFPGFGVYCASKWGLEGLSEAMRYELAPLGIDVALVEPGPFETNFFGNMVPNSDPSLEDAYSHVQGFMDGFGQNVMNMYQDENAPTDPMIIVKIFEDLIDAEPGNRPVRNVGGLDFGVRALNDATEAFRKAGLEGMGISEWDNAGSN